MVVFKPIFSFVFLKLYKVITYCIPIFYGKCISRNLATFSIKDYVFYREIFCELSAEHEINI